MDDDEAKKYSPTFQKRRDAAQSDYFADPVTVLFEVQDRLRDSLKHHGYDSDPKMIDDADWLIVRMNELVDALIVSRTKLPGGKRIYVNFSDQFATKNT